MDSLPPLETLAGGDVGGELAAILQSIAEISADRGAKFTPAVCRRLARWIVCRSYARPLRELCHLVRIAERRFGAQGFETLFWDGSAASPANFRRLLADAADGIRETGTGIAACYPDGEFAVAFTRMPFLAALMEFLVSVLGYAGLDALFRPGPEHRLTHRSVDAMANDLARRLYAWLAPHLPSAQSQRKYRAAIAFLQGGKDASVRPQDIDDDAVLAFWIFGSADRHGDGDFRSFRTVFDLMVGVRDALIAAATHAAIMGARVLGGDRTAGEIDPDAVDAALEAVHERRAPFEALAAPPASEVKFLKGTEADALAPIVRAGDAALALPLSVLRLLLFGAVQTRISQALRRGDRDAVPRLVDCADGMGYASQLNVLAGLRTHLEQALLASCHNLLQARHEEAITVMLYLRPAADLTPLAALFDGGEDDRDTVVRLVPPRAGERFVHAIVADPSLCPELGVLLHDAAAAARRMTRKGFQGPLPRTDGAPFAAAVEALITLREAVGRFLDRIGRIGRDAAAWDTQCRADGEIFQARFRTLYGECR